MPPEPPPQWVIARRREVGERIRATRIRENLTQERLAEMASIERQSVGQIEGGHVSPRLDTLLRIADALDTPLSDLVRHTGGPRCS